MKKVLSFGASVVAVLFMAASAPSALAQCDDSVGQPDSCGWYGYAVVFDSDADGGAYVFDQQWGQDDLKSERASSTEAILKPNYNAYANADAGTDAGDKAFWMNGAVGNKKFQGILYQFDTVGANADTYDFEGTVDYTLVAGYEVQVYLKVDGDEINAPVSATGAFSLSADAQGKEGTTVEYGWRITGLNANPADEATLGSASFEITTADTVELPPPPPPPPATDATPVPALPLWGLLGLLGLMGLVGARARRQ